eukprot:scaffold24340_cov20-Tisochrysis_lutea.AAC.1
MHWTQGTHGPQKAHGPQGMHGTRGTHGIQGAHGLQKAHGPQANYEPQGTHGAQGKHGTQQQWLPHQPQQHPIMHPPLLPRLCWPSAAARAAVVCMPLAAATEVPHARV